MRRVFVVDTNKKPLAPCTPARARMLLRKGKAAVYRREPFTIILKRGIEETVPPAELRIDPGSRTTGIAVVGETQRGRKVVWACDLQHRGLAVRDALTYLAGPRWPGPTPAPDQSLLPDTTTGRPSSSVTATANTRPSWPVNGFPIGAPVARSEGHSTGPEGRRSTYDPDPDSVITEASARTLESSRGLVSALPPSRTARRRSRRLAPERRAGNAAQR